MAIFRVEKNKNYTVMSNHHLRDKNLSLKARGLLSLMLSLPVDWDYTLVGLAYICKDGITSIRTTVMELEENKYLSRIEYVIGRMAKNTTKIRNIRNYLLTALYNSIQPWIIFIGLQ